MKVFTSVAEPELVELLLHGSVGVLRTDTLYGLVAVAGDKTAVERVYSLKGRDGNKSPIVLIGDSSQLYDHPSEAASEYLQTVWPGPNSVILPSSEAPSWITRGNESVAYRIPAKPELRELLAKTGPLIAPSANLQGRKPATSLDEATAYFGDKIDFYVDEGTVMDLTPSRLMKILDDGSVERLR